MPICIGSVSESVSVKFSTLYLVSKVSEKSGIGPPLVLYTAFFMMNMIRGDPVSLPLPNR